MSDNATARPRRPATTRRRAPAPGPVKEYQLPVGSLACLCALIAKHNPYTNGGVDDMDIHLHPPAPDDPNNDKCSQVDWEQDGGYPGDFVFKGQPQKINKVLRFKYRARRASDGSWMTAYLLVAFENGTG
jgi:hypothetical protein